MIGVGGEGDLLNRLCLIRRAFDLPLVDVPFEVVFVDFEQMRGDLAGFGLDLARCHRRRCA